MIAAALRHFLALLWVAQGFVERLLQSLDATKSQDVDSV